MTGQQGDTLLPSIDLLGFLDKWPKRQKKGNDKNVAKQFATTLQLWCQTTLNVKIVDAALH